MINLTIKRILEFYDVPQLFVAVDTLGINYLCVLYDHDNGFEYLGVQISELRLGTFLTGESDLRKIYVSPEQENSLYRVIVTDKQVKAETLLQPGDITENMLPEPGFYYDSDDAIDNSNTDSMQIEIPVRDRGFFTDMVTRMGWVTKTMDKAVKRVAIF